MSWLFYKAFYENRMEWFRWNPFEDYADVRCCKYCRNMLVKSAALLLFGQTETEESTRYRLHGIFSLRSSLDPAWLYSQPLGLGLPIHFSFSMMAFYLVWNRTGLMQSVNSYVIHPVVYEWYCFLSDVGFPCVCCEYHGLIKKLFWSYCSTE